MARLCLSTAHATPATLRGMKTLASQFPALIWPFIWVGAASLSVWATLATASILLGGVSVLLSLLAAYTAARALRERQARPSHVLSRQGWFRLGLWASGLVMIGLVGTGVQLAYDRAYGLVHPGHIPTVAQPAEVGLTDYQSVSFLTSDGLTLRGWYMPAHNASVVIFVHGHGGNRGALLAEAAYIVAYGYGALLYDTRNSGESEGTLTTFGLLEVNDVSAAVDFALAQPGVERVALLGHSMGAGTVLMAGARLPGVSAVVAESAFSSLEDNVANGVRHLTGLPAFPFAPLVVFFGQREAGMDIRQARPIDAIADLSPRPVLLVHGALDKAVPVTNAYALYAAAQEPKELYLLDDAGHDDLLLTGGPEFQTRILNFLDKALGQSP